jgi:hypothetical protein
MQNENRLIYAECAKSMMRELMERELYMAEGCVDSCPTVDAVEVVHAEWACVNESENVWMCTGKNGCGNEILLLEGTPSENGWYYCPSCGAKMDGEREDPDA